MAKKIKTELVTLCDYAMTSQQGKLSILGLFDRIFVTQVPSKYPRFFIVAIVTGEPNTGQEISLAIQNPSGSDLLPSRSLKLNLGGNGKANIITDIANLTLSEVGEYKILIKSEDISVAETSFFVNKVNPKQPGEEKKN